MSGKFDGSIAWITGGSSGIGRALAVELASQGARVAVSARREERLEETVAAIEGAGSEGLAVACDVTDETAVYEAVEQVRRELGPLDIAVANAGFSVAGSFEKLTADDWRRQLEVNVVGAAITARAALPDLRATRGRLGLVGSVAGLIPAPKLSAYCASKYAVRAMGQVLAMELHGSGVSCTLIEPGFVESEIVQVDNEGQRHPEREDRRPENLVWPAEKAARAIAGALHARKREFVFTGHGRVAAFLGKHSPGLVHFATTRFGG